MTIAPVMRKKRSEGIMMGKRAAKTYNDGKSARIGMRKRSKGDDERVYEENICWVDFEEQSSGVMIRKGYPGVVMKKMAAEVMLWKILQWL